MVCKLRMYVVFVALIVPHSPTTLIYFLQGCHNEDVVRKAGKILSCWEPRCSKLLSSMGYDSGFYVAFLCAV